MLKNKGFNLTEFDDTFNLTMTYRRDSDIFFPYQSASGIYYKMQNLNMSFNMEKLMEKKHKVALWVVSNGYLAGAQKRLQLTEDLLKAGLKLDRRGGLFPNAGNIPNLWKREEFREFIKQYKFYLSFENQYHCKDYITEKLWRNGFLSEAVPVVWGARKSDYQSVIPPNSVIFAEDYTPTQLVEYLNYLDRNDTAYKEYFRWRTLDVTDLPDYNRQMRFCQLCRVLHGINVDNIFNPKFEEKLSHIPLFGYSSSARTIHSLKKAFYDDEYEECY